MSEPEAVHIPVLLDAVLDLLDPRPGEVVLDGTVGLGGHAERLLERIMPDGLLIGMDLDERMLAIAGRRLARFGDRVRLAKGNFADFEEALEQFEVRRVNVMLVDLGINSAQLDDPIRGLSFGQDGPLDMRLDREQQTQALDLVNSMPEDELADVIYDYGQESFARKIARRIRQIRQDRRITTTRQLAGIVEWVYVREGRAGRSKTHPATRTFQALRIAVNRELENLERFLPRAIERLAPGGRLGVISFHSLEDGVAKRAMREARKAGVVRELTNRPLVPDAAEVKANPRSRSAKLRVSQRVEDA